MNALWLILAGAAGGVIAGMGMGGGTLTIPLLTLALDVEQKAAQAVNLAAFVVMSLPVLAIHIKNKLVDFPAFFKASSAALIGCAVCAWFAADVPAQILSKCFGGFLIALGVWQGAAAIKNKTSGKKRFVPRHRPPVRLNCLVLCESGSAYYDKGGKPR